ncbi:hypothetical protein [Mycobacterium sp. NAZ190054]|uniref:hypothetical protein n=1 Tax=Mycobacterium sp. NAZ190054 TaxID=1747766 RepID=UPI000796AC59|nr:hypothetical protein [Mycobacterium sp. NAZ190054]KWX66820.1 hypothetical protein ASJ79_05500 [Mycobacterium sp. NAZ190054]
MSFEAKYQGRCAECDDRIEPGEQATYADDDLVHVACETEPAREDDPDEVCTACRLVHSGECF